MGARHGQWGNKIQNSLIQTAEVEFLRKGKTCSLHDWINNEDIRAELVIYIMTYTFFKLTETEKISGKNEERKTL